MTILNLNSYGAEEHSITFDEIKLAQSNDPFIISIVNYLEKGELPADDKEIAHIVSWSRFMCIQDGILFHVKNLAAPGRRRSLLMQIVVPRSLISKVLEVMHASVYAGHTGILKTFERTRKQFFWVNMMKDIVEFVNSCDNCQKMKNPPARRTRVPYLQRPQPSFPWEVASMDVMHLPSSDRNKYVLIIVDLFTRWPEAFALPNINGAALKTCMRKVMSRQGFIRQLLCDNASYNVGKEFSTFCDQERIQLSPVSEYRPEANGVAESKVKALKDLLRALATKFSNWSKYLDTALFAYRTSYHPVVKDTPFFLNHGRDPWFPNAANPEHQMDRKNPETFNLELDDSMQTVYRLVKQNLEDRQKKLFVKADSLPNYFDIGQSVFFYNPIVPEGQHPKFHQYWQGPYTIIQKLSPVVYKIQRDSNLAEIRRAHVDRLKRRFIRAEKEVNSDKQQSTQV